MIQQVTPKDPQFLLESMEMEGEKQFKDLYNSYYVIYYVICTVGSDLQLYLLQISVCPFPFLSSLTSPFPTFTFNKN